MKVIRLNEASMSEIKMAEEAYDAAYGDGKLEVVDQFLRDIVKIKTTSPVLIAIKNFGINFVDKWVTAMRWDELGRDSNEFVNLLKTIDKDDCPVIRDINNFSKIYNVYSDGNIENDFINNSFWSTVVMRDLPQLELWTRDDSDFRETMSYIHTCMKDKGITDPDELSKIFFEEDGGSLKSVPEIRQTLGITGKKQFSKDNIDVSKLNDEQAKDLAGALVNREGMKDYIKTLL